MSVSFWFKSKEKREIQCFRGNVFVIFKNYVGDNSLLTSYGLSFSYLIVKNQLSTSLETRTWKSAEFHLLKFPRKASVLGQATSPRKIRQYRLTQAEGYCNFCIQRLWRFHCILLLTNRQKWKKMSGDGKHRQSRKDDADRGVAMGCMKQKKGRQAL